MINRGKIISDYIDREGINKSVLVKKILFGGKIRTYRTLLNKLSEPNLSLEDVLSFSKALNHDFTQHIPELKTHIYQHNVLNEPQEIYGKKQIDYKEKYFSLLEEQNNLLKQEKATTELFINIIKELLYQLNKEKGEGFVINENIKSETSGGDKKITDILHSISHTIEQIKGNKK